MNQTFRDQVRLRWPRALAFYQRHVATRLGADGRQFELSDWARVGTDLVRRTGMHGIRFERDGVWIDDGAGFLWAYEPGPFTTTLWAELGRRYEELEIQTLAAHLPAGGTLIDIGANVGLHSVQLARLVADLRVFAFEPVSDTFALLQRNIAKNGVSGRVSPRRLAISDHEGMLTLTTSFQFANFVVPDGAPVARDAGEEVRTSPLDDVVAELTDRVDAIKCDVEGAELAVLRGAAATLERFHPTILIEIDDRWARRYGNTGADTFAFLTQRGYRYQRFAGDQVLPPSGSLERDLAEGANFLFTPAGS